MRFDAVGQTPDGIFFDLQLTNTSRYSTWNNARNAINGEFGQVNVNGLQRETLSMVIGQGATLYEYVDLRFAFLERGSDTPLTLAHPVFFTFYDLDAAGSLGNRECIAASGATVTSLSSYSNLLQSVDVHPDKYFNPPRTRYCAPTSGAQENNPQSAAGLTDAQKARTVMFEFQNVDSFEVRTLEAVVLMSADEC